MADPITNAQYALGLFQPALAAAGRANERNLMFAQHQADNARKDAITYWIRKMDREDAASEREFRDEQSTKAIGAQLAGQKEATDRIIAQMDATEKRQKEAEVRKLYDEYTQLAPGEALPLADFGKDVDERFQSLSRETNRLRQTVLLTQGVQKLAEDYKKLNGKKSVLEFGETPSEQIQGLSAAIGELQAQRAKNSYMNISREFNTLSDQIAEAEKLTPEELQQAESQGIKALGADAREAFMRFRATLGSDKAALDKISKVYPADVNEYNSAVNQAKVGLKILKKENDKSLRELYDNQSQLRLLQAQAAAKLGEIDPEQIIGMFRASPKTSSTPAAPGRAIINDVIRRPPQPTSSVPNVDVQRTVLPPPPPVLEPYVYTEQKFNPITSLLGAAVNARREFGTTLEDAGDYGATKIQNLLGLIRGNQMMPPKQPVYPPRTLRTMTGKEYPIGTGY